MYVGLHVKYQLPCEIFIKPELSRRIFQKYSNSMNVSSPGAELFHADGQDKRADGQRDMTKLTVAFGNSENALKIRNTNTTTK